MSGQLKIGIIGTGIFAEQTHLPVIEQLSDKFKVTAATNRTKSKAIAFAKKAGLSEDNVYESADDLLDRAGVDCIDVLVPVANNDVMVEKAIKHNTPVIIEKPIAANLDQARRIISLTDNSDVPVAYAENWLYLNAAQEVKKCLPKIGNILAFTYNSTGPFVEKNQYLATEWRKNPEHIGGFLSDGGVHQLALLTDIVGQLDSVSALTQQNREKSGDQDSLFATVRTKAGVIGTFTYGSSYGAVDKSTFLKIYGSEGSVMLDLSDKGKAKLRIIHGKCAEEASEPQESVVEQEISYGVKGEFTNFYEAVVKKDKSIIKGSPRTVFHHLACVDAFLKSSAKEGDHVKVVDP